MSTQLSITPDGIPIESAAEAEAIRVALILSSSGRAALDRAKEILKPFGADECFWIISPSQLANKDPRQCYFVPLAGWHMDAAPGLMEAVNNFQRRIEAAGGARDRFLSR